MLSLEHPVLSYLVNVGAPSLKGAEKVTQTQTTWHTAAAHGLLPLYSAVATGMKNADKGNQQFSLYLTLFLPQSILFLCVT